MTAWPTSFGSLYSRVLRVRPRGSLFPGSRPSCWPGALPAVPALPVLFPARALQLISPRSYSSVSFPIHSLPVFLIDAPPNLAHKEGCEQRFRRADTSRGTRTPFSFSSDVSFESPDGAPPRLSARPAAVEAASVRFRYSLRSMRAGLVSSWFVLEPLGQGRLGI